MKGYGAVCMCVCMYLCIYVCVYEFAMKNQHCFSVDPGYLLHQHVILSSFQKGTLNKGQSTRNYGMSDLG
jgi:hypothetical protein